jgi:hypothetical protein
MRGCWQDGVLQLLRVRLVPAAEVVPGAVLLLARARSVAHCGSTTGARQLLALVLLAAGVLLLLLLLLVVVLLVAGVVAALPLLEVVAGVVVVVVVGRLVLCWQVRAV